MIDPHAIVSDQAKIGRNVHIGPWTIIGDQVEVGDDTWIGPHVVISGRTKIGKRNKIFQFSSIGEAPQDKKYQEEDTALEIGDDNIIREACTIHRGTKLDRGATIIGSGNLLMVNTHIAHDCILDDHTVLANNTTLAGHVQIDSYAILGGHTAIHQFCRVGAYAFTAGGSIVLRDIPPYVMVSGNSAIPHGINVEGLRRHGFSEQTRTLLKRAYKAIYRDGLNLQQALDKLEDMLHECEDIGLMLDFIRMSSRGIVR